MYINNKIFVRIFLFLLISLITNIFSYDYGFFYDNYKEEIYFNTQQNPLSIYIYPEDDLLKSSNKQNEYYSKAKKNKFKIEHYLVSLYSISSSPLYLFKVTFNITKPKFFTVKEVILDLFGTTEKKLSFPKNYTNDFSILENRDAANDGRKRRKTKIYDTFGFSIKSKKNINFKIVKLLLLNYRKNKFNYLANLSGDVQKTYNNNNNTFDIYLKDMPEYFNLYITLEIYDNNWEDTGEKILIIQNDFNYPNYILEDANPNKKVFIIAVVIICIAFILIIIFVLLKFLLC